MIKLMISHMSFMTNEWNVPHHVLNDLFVMTLGLLIIFVLYDWNTSYKLNHIFEDFF
jgi:hypothetical protein